MENTYTLLNGKEASREEIISALAWHYGMPWKRTEKDYEDEVYTPEEIQRALDDWSGNCDEGKDSAGTPEFSTTEFLKAQDEGTLVPSAKMIRESILAGTYNPQSLIAEETSPIKDVYLVKEPYGNGVAVELQNGVIYKYTADDNNPKYNTPELLLKAVKGLAKHRAAGPVFGWLRKNAIYYAKINNDGHEEGANIPQQETQDEAVSLDPSVSRELSILIGEKYPDLEESARKEKVASFLSENKITTTDQYYAIPSKKLLSMIK